MSKENATESDNQPINIFRDKIAERIRNDMSDLMPDQLLTEVIENAVKTELYRNVSANNHQTLPWINKILDGELRQKIREMVDTALTKHEAEIQKMIADEIKERLPEFIAVVITSILKGQTSNIEYTVQNIMSRY